MVPVFARRNESCHRNNLRVGEILAEIALLAAARLRNTGQHQQPDGEMRELHARLRMNHATQKPMSIATGANRPGPMMNSRPWGNPRNCRSGR